jgi:hypothetical protein
LYRVSAEDAQRWKEESQRRKEADEAAKTAPLGPNQIDTRLGRTPTNVGVATPAHTPVAVATPHSDNVTNEKAAPVLAETPEMQRAAYTKADNELNAVWNDLPEKVRNFHQKEQHNWVL